MEMFAVKFESGQYYTGKRNGSAETAAGAKWYSRKGNAKSAITLHSEYGPKWSGARVVKRTLSETEEVVQ